MPGNDLLRLAAPTVIAFIPMNGSASADEALEVLSLTRL